MASAGVLARALATTRDLRRGKSDQPRLLPTAEGFRASTPIATQIKNDSLAPRSTSAATPREPSAFIRTTDQSPSRTSQVTVCFPGPEADAAQKFWAVGGRPGAAPAT